MPRCKILAGWPSRSTSEGEDRRRRASVCLAKPSLCQRVLENAGFVAWSSIQRPSRRVHVRNRFCCTHEAVFRGGSASQLYVSFLSLAIAPDHCCVCSRSLPDAAHVDWCVARLHPGRGSRQELSRGRPHSIGPRLEFLGS